MYRNENLVFEGSEYYYRVLLNELGEDDYQENSSLVRLMSKLQHHGAATRMLDVTTNPLIALYFAAQSYDKNDCNGDDDGYVYIYSSKNKPKNTSEKGNEEKAKKEKFDTGHTIAIKSACNFIDQQKLNDFLDTMKNLVNSKCFSHQVENTYEKSNKDLTLDELTGVIKDKKMRNITEFMELLNQRAKTKERLVFPFKIYDDLKKAHIVLPAKSTDRIRQQQGAFIYPCYVETKKDENNRNICQINKEINKSIEDLSARLKYNKFNYTKFKIIRSRKGIIRKQLEMLGITKGFIYADIQNQSDTLLNQLGNKNKN